MKNYSLHFIIFSLFSIASYGQKMFTTTEGGDLVTLEYSNYLDLNNVQFDNKSIAIDFSSLLKESNLGLGMTYTNNSIDFVSYDRTHNYSMFETIHNVEIFARYKKAIVNNWTMDLVLVPYLSSTLNDKISNDDFILSYSANFTKTWYKDGLKSALKLGVGYGALFGKPDFYPLISYASNVNEKLRYEIGIPITGVFYELNEQNGFDFTVEPESIYAYNGSDYRIENGQIIHNSELEFKAIKFELGYNFKFDNNWSTNFNVGYLVDSELTISENDNNIYDFDSGESLSLNIGISFNINNK